MEEKEDGKAVAEKLDLLIQELQPVMRQSIRLTLRIFKHQATKAAVEELCQQISLLLMADDYRRLRSFDRRSSLNTWLRQVIQHQVGHYLKQNNETEELSEAVINSQIYAATQEAEVWNLEQNSLLLQAVTQLSLDEQRFYLLLCGDNLSMEEIAAQRGITTPAAYKQKQRLIKKMQALIEDLIAEGSKNRKK